LRQEKLKFANFDNLEEPPHDAPRAEAVAQAAFAMGNPLKAELYLDENRWNAINNIQGNHLFHANVIFVHLVKLILMQRRVLFDTDSGLAEYKTLYASILENANRKDGQI
jgi:hypothetical protein